MTLTPGQLVKDFSIDEAGIPPFKFNGPEEYHPVQLLGGKTLARVAGLGTRLEQTADLEAKIDVLADAFDLLLEQESAARLRKRLDEKTDKPVDFIRQAVPCFKWLMEQLSGKATQPSAGSSNGSAGAGPSSTAGAPPKASTRAGSKPVGFSTSSSTTALPGPNRKTSRK